MYDEQLQASPKTFQCCTNFCRMQFLTLLCKELSIWQREGFLQSPACRHTRLTLASNSLWYFLQTWFGKLFILFHCEQQIVTLLLHLCHCCLVEGEQCEKAHPVYACNLVVCSIT